MRTSLRKRALTHAYLLGFLFAISCNKFNNNNSREPTPTPTAGIPVFVYDYMDRRSGGSAIEASKADKEAADFMRDYLKRNTLNIGDSWFWYDDERKGVLIEAKEKAQIIVTHYTVTDADRLNDAWHGFVEFRATAWRSFNEKGRAWDDWQSHSLSEIGVAASLLGKSIELKKTKGKWEDVPLVNSQFRKPLPEEIPKELEPENGNSLVVALKQTFSGSVFPIAFSPDGKTLATSGTTRGTTGDYSMAVKLWDVQTGVLKQTFAGDRESIASVAFSPDGKLLAGGTNGAVKVWDAQTGALSRILGVYNGAYSLAFSPDGKTLAIGGLSRTVELWDVQAGALKQALSPGQGLYPVAFSTDGKTLATGGYNAKLWDVQTGMLKQTLTPGGSLYSVTFSPDGKTLAGGDSDGTVKFWDVQTGGLKQTLANHSKVVNSVAFSPDGKTLASGSWDKTVKLWDVRTGALRKVLTISGNVVSVAFSPDRSALACAGNNATLWDVSGLR